MNQYTRIISSHLRRLALVACVAIAMAGSHASAAEPPPIADYVKLAMFDSAKLSPDGKHLALTVPRGDQDALAIFRVADLSLVKLHTLPEKRSFYQFDWTGSERIIFSTMIKRGSAAPPFLTGDVYAVNMDGSKQRELFSEMLGYGRATAGSKKTSFMEAAYVLDPLPEDPRRALLLVGTGGSRNGQPSEIYEVDTFTARRERLAKAPLAACGTMVLDTAKFARFANCQDDHGESLLYGRTPEATEWRLLNDSGKSGKRINVSAVGPDGRVYASLSDKKAPAAVGTLDPASGKFTQLHQHPLVDPLYSLDSLDGKQPLAVAYMPAKSELHFIDEEHPDTAVLKSLIAGFPDQHVNITGAGLNGRYAVISVSSDRDPGQFYLYDREKGEARFLMKRRPWIDPAQMAEVRPIELKARDGTPLHGYLTIPPGRALKNLPLIVNPHGGPHGPRDMWGFSEDTQVLASRGYLVLQVNFRGSGGYGEAFEEAGYREWGGKIQDDIIDATRWAIEQGYADGDRVCTYGASFGGYSALMAPIRAPEVFNCAIGVAGVYDLQLLFEDGDVQQRTAGNNYLHKVLGGQEAIDAFSPVKQADRLEAPVLIVHGKLDVRAPLSQADELRRQLEKRKHPYEWLVEPLEGHGFYDPENKEGMYRQVFAFLNKHMRLRTGEAGELIPLRED